MLQIKNNNYWVLLLVSLLIMHPKIQNLYQIIKYNIYNKIKILKKYIIIKKIHLVLFDYFLDNAPKITKPLPNNKI